jgi:DNA-binding CsgD family transcriptional regulator
MLSPREIDVLRLLSRGCSYADVAQHLGISVHTVGTHIKNAYRKLSVRTAAAAVTRAAELGFLALKSNGNGGDAGGNIGADVDRDCRPRGLERGELALEER